MHHRQQTHQRHPSVQRTYTSPMEAPGVVELRNMIDRYLEVGNFEEAFVKVRFRAWFLRLGEGSVHIYTQHARIYVCVLLIPNYTN